MAARRKTSSVGKAAVKASRAPIKPIAAADPISGKSGRFVVAFDAAKNARRLRAVPTNTAEINTLTRQYGKNVVARSRYLSQNNGYVTAARREFASALIGDGIVPSSMVKSAELKKAIQLAWLDWTDEADADGLTDFYGLQTMIANELFDAGECFVRFRPRLPTDGLSVPLQIQLLPSEMLPLDKNERRPNGNVIESGIEFNGIGKRVAYHFWRRHPGSDKQFLTASVGETVAVPAEQVLHIFNPIQAGQIRGLPHTLSGIVTMAILDLYEDAELERKRVAALFGAFVTKEDDEGAGSIFDRTAVDGANPPGIEPSDSFALEPGATVELRPGEDIKFAEPADVGGNYEAFMIRNLLKAAAGYGIPYAAMTGDLRQANYGSIRAGLVQFRRFISQLQNHVMIFQLCRPVWQRWMDSAVLVGAIEGMQRSQYVSDPRSILRVKWITPRWEWVDPLKDRQAEKVAVDNGYKPRSAVIEAEGYDPEEVDETIAADRDRAEALDLQFPLAAAGSVPPVDPNAPEPNNPPEPSQPNDNPRRPRPAPAPKQPRAPRAPAGGK